MENSMFITVIGWLIALASLAVNVLQLLQNKALREKVSNASLKQGSQSEATQQVHSGSGDNVAVRGNMDLKK